MDIVKFPDHTWQEIPEQDNPALDYRDYSDGKHRPCACLMIFKGRYKGFADGGIVVASVPISGDITLKGVFWNMETAETFAETLAEMPVDELFPGTIDGLNKISINAG
jgi:hypothetical protein